ncbi:Uncharacterised protein [Mycobacteroides abscessus]|nr:Uncharacterised protein [Mycobacteroides abscessus]
MRDYQQAATELALLHDRVERGAVEAWRVEGQRRALLQLMLTARQAFLVRAPQPPPAPWSPGAPSGFTSGAWAPGPGLR